MTAEDDQRLLARQYRIPQDMAHLIQGDTYEAKAEYTQRMAEFLKAEDALASDAEFFRSRSPRQPIDMDAWRAAEAQRKGEDP